MTSSATNRVTNKPATIRISKTGYFEIYRDNQLFTGGSECVGARMCARVGVCACVGVRVMNTFKHAFSFGFNGFEI